MKKLIFLFMVVGFMAKGQSYQSLIDNHKCELPIDSTTGLIYQEIITEVPGASAKELYTRFKVWSATAFKSLPDVMKLDDPENSMVILKGQFDFFYEIKYGVVWHGYFTMSANFKDGKYRVVIDNVGYQGADYTDYGSPVKRFHPWQSELWEKSMMKKMTVSNGIELEKSFVPHLTQIKKSLIEGMKKQSNSKSDW